MTLHTAIEQTVKLTAQFRKYATPFAKSLTSTRTYKNTPSLHQPSSMSTTFDVKNVGVKGCVRMCLLIGRDSHKNITKKSDK